MKITAAIPSYNKEKYIGSCIKSILVNKQYVDKIILVDNCSSDKTFNIAKKFEPDIQCYRNKKNLGMSGNWNRCIELCDTDWLMIIHADDELLPGAIECYIDFIKKYPSVGLIHANSYSMKEDDASSKIVGIKKQKEFWKAGLDAMSCHYGVCSAVMVKKEVYDKLGYFIDSLSSDAEMWARIAAHYDVGFIKAPTVIYRINETSLGPSSLVNRSIKEIKTDWDTLTEKTANSYPTKESRDMFLKKSFKESVGNYWGVAKVNLKSRNYVNFIQAIYLIIFTYQGLLPLISLVSRDIKNKIIRKLAQIKNKICVGFMP